MAGYLRQQVKKITSSKYTSELQENRKSIPGTTTTTTISDAADSITDRARFLKNPAILDTLDTVHRSLLFNNLKFDTDECSDLDGSSITNYSTLPDNQRRPKEELLESSAAKTREPSRDQIHDKVNIVEASTDVRSSREKVVSQEVQHLETCGIVSPTNEYVSLDDELEALFRRDWNNNLNGEHIEPTISKVKMMVHQYEQNKGKMSQPVRTTAHTGDMTELCTELALPDVSSIGDAETSDFESASVTSGSSVYGDGGRRSVRTSSAFSEGSRDVASIDRFDLGVPASQQQKQQEDLAGHNTMITININYRCDTNPPRTSKATSAEKDVVGKTVDIMVSAPPQAVTESNRKSLENDKGILRHAAERHVLHTPGVEEEELMDLEQEQPLTDELLSSESEARTNEAVIDDAGSESMTAAKRKDYRGSLTNNRSCRTPDDEEYHDCDELHESTLSFYEQAFSQPVTPQEPKKRSSSEHSSNVDCSDELDGEQPMIQIVQELSEDHSEVTSTITLNKAQIRDMQKANGARRSADAAEELKRHSPPDGKSSNEKRRKSHSGVTTKKRHDKSNLQRQQRIMDDNFCNEILDSTIHFDRLYGNNRPRRAGLEEGDVVSSPSPTRPMAEECFSDSVVCEIASPGEESFDSVMSVGKLEGKPRFSGKTVGRLMMKRLKKLQGAGVGAQKTLDTSDASTSSSQQLSGPKKPPRTFANSPQRSSALPVPSCPTAKDVEESDSLGREIGWKLNTKPRSHQVGWTVPAANGKNEAIPAQIYSMLNYSEDEGRKKLIKTGNSKPAPQQSTSSKEKNKYWPDGEPLGPKMAIDTVDGTRTPSRRHSTSTDFERFVRESNVKSTPHRKSDVSSRIETRRRIEQFLCEERHQVPEGQRKLPGMDRRRRTTGGIFERRRQQQENFLDDARRTNHEPRRKKIPKSQGSSITPKTACCPAATIVGTSSRTNGSACSGGKVEKRRTFRKAALLKRTRTLFEASKKKIWSLKRFETPKKQNVVSNTSPSNPSDRDPNINRNSSAKKKYNLHHKHLGYTPVHLRCKTCGSERADGEREEAVVPINYRPTRQAPFPQASSHSPKDENKENQCSTVNRDGRQRRSGTENNRKSARSLNFASAPQGQRLNTAPVERETSPEEEASPRKSEKPLSETKFLKTLRNLKISPKRIFRFASQSSTALDNRSTTSESHVQGEFQSYDDLNLDNVANMGDFLSNIRRKIAGNDVDNPIIGRESLQRATVDRSVVPVDVHGQLEDPIYQEISPKTNKMVLNEFISSDTNKRYLMVNNNPNILYAMVESKAVRSSERLVRARSLTTMHASSSVTDPTVTSTPVSKPQNNTSKSHMKPSNRRVTMSPHMEGRAVDIVDSKERDNSLYNTALSENLATPRRRTVCGVVNSEGTSGRANRSFNATESSTSSSIRRSLFSRKTSPDHHRSLLQQHQHSTDDSDISILQEEESREDESSLESLPEEPIVNEPLIVRERVEDRLAFRKENEHFQQNPPASASAIGSRGRYVGTQEDLFAFEKDIIIERTMGGKNVKAGIESGAGMGQNLIVLKAHKSVQVKVDGNGAAPLGCFDTDSEIDSLRKYDDREIEELVHSLHDNVTLSDMGTVDTETNASSSMGHELDTIGYDTVDLAPPVSRAFHQPVGRNLTIDTVDVSELISHAPEDSLSVGNLSPITSSPSSSKMSTSGTAVMRNLKDKLRSSFRKSRSFIKNERRRIANYLLEDRTGSKSPSVTSTTSSPRKHTTLHANTVGHKQGSRRKQESDIESDDMYQSFTHGSNSIVTGSSMTELSSQHMNKLMQQIIIQSDVRKQLKHAVAICRSTREFECSPELIEAERLLLIATQKETAVRNELNKIDYLTNGMTLAESKRVGTVTLSNFEFPLKETAIRDALFNYFYIVVCTYKHEVKATIAKERDTDGRVCFSDCAIQFKNLDANYEIKVEVFVLQLRKNVKNYSFESRYHLDQDNKRPLSCPSPSKKLREAGRLLSFRSNSSKTFDFDNEFSRFKSQGFLTLTSFMLLTASGIEGEDVSGEEKPFNATYATARTNNTTHMSGDEAGHSYYSTSGNFQPVIQQQDDQSVVLKAEDFKYLTLDSMAYTSNMVGTIGMSVHSEVRFDGSDMRGFLDVGEKVDGNEGITWSRRWCQINGFVLEFWNYPQECQEKQPILQIDLVKCINERVELAERTICSRPRTVRVEIFSSRVAAPGASCNSSGIGSLRSSGRTTSPSSVGETAACSSGRSHLRPISPSDGGRNHNNVTCYLLATDTQSDLKGWMNELNRVVKFLKEWKI